MGLANVSTPENEAAARQIAQIRRMIATMGFSSKLAGIKAADIPKLVRYADKEANPLYPVPKLMDAGEPERFY